jgi:chorismate synthase
MLRILTAGESHGPACIAIIEGMPAGVAISLEGINYDLKRRHSDFGRGGRGLIEEDKAEILSGIRYGRTLGSPITLMVRNLDFANWSNEMRIEASTEKEADRVTRPRPGHADLAGVLKYGHEDIRNISERASARETVSRVMAGAIIRQLLLAFGIRIASHTVQIGKVRLAPRPYDFNEVASVFEKDPEIRCIDPETSQQMKAAITMARKKKDTLGGVVEVIATGLPVGLGSVMHYDRRLDSQIAQALMSIPSVKAVEIGNAIAGAGQSGAEFHDEIAYRKPQFIRHTNNMGGIEGGMSNGEDIMCRAYLKPIATLVLPARTVDIRTHRPTRATVERSDICVVPRAGVVAETMLAAALGQALTEKFGGDHIDEMRRNFEPFTKPR